MNSKQFFNSSIVLGADKFRSAFPRISAGARAFLDLLSPRFARVPLPEPARGPISFRRVVAGYVFVVTLLLLIPGTWAALNGVFLPDANPDTKNFLEDTENLLNYLVIVPGYCIIGFWFLQQTYTVRDDLDALGVPVPDPPPNTSLARRGYLGALLIFFFSMLGAAGYAEEVREYESFYWFMSSGPPNAQYGGLGFYYLFANVFLLAFVLWVAAGHFELMRVGSDLATKIRDALQSNASARLAEWEDEKKNRIRLAPFSRFVLASKLMVFFLFLNMLTWKMNEPNVSVMYSIGVFLVAVLGIWVFSLPRYAVQYRLFLIRAKAGHQDYPDIRLPWVKGVAALIDVLLFGYLVSYMLGDATATLFEQILS